MEKSESAGTGEVLYLPVRLPDVQPLAGLRAKFGVFAITGNRECYFDASTWIHEYEQLGMTVLADRHANIVVGGQCLYIAGVTDIQSLQVGEMGPNLTEALDGLPIHFAIVLLNHRPLNTEAAEHAGVGLRLSGHTHGGMMRGLDEVAKPANDGYISGVYHVGHMLLYVSTGTALWNGFPIRLGVPREIAEFILRATRHVDAA